VPELDPNIISSVFKSTLGFTGSFLFVFLFLIWFNPRCQDWKAENPHPAEKVLQDWKEEDLFCNQGGFPLGHTWWWTGGV